MIRFFFIYSLQVLESIEKVLAQRHLYSESTIIEIELVN